MLYPYQVTYLGGPTAIFEIGGLRLMTDPTLDPAGTHFPLPGHPGYSKLKGPAIKDIGPIDIVLLSHDQHNDNLDNAGRALLQKVQTTLTTESGSARLNSNSTGLSPWESRGFKSLAGDYITITGTPARHGPAGSEKLTGEVTGFIISVKGKKDFVLYITGDTVFYEGVTEVAQKYKPQNVFIFAGAAQARGPFNLTMGSNDALDTAAAFPTATITPLHFEGWTHYTEGGDILQRAFTSLGIAERLKILQPGLPTELPIR